MMALVIVGFAVGEPLLAFADNITNQLGVGVGIGKELVVGGSYAIAGILLLLLKTGEKEPQPEQEQNHVFQDLRDGFRYLGENKRIRNALIQLVILFSIFAALAVLAVRMAEVIPGLKSSQFGFLLAAGGVGVAAGATLLGQYGQRFSHVRLSFYGSLGMAACLIALSIFTKELWIVLIALALLGVFSASVRQIYQVKMLPAIAIAAKLEKTACKPIIVSATPAKARGKLKAILITLFCNPNTFPRISAGVSC